jgi:hypothetical protein
MRQTCPQHASQRHTKAPDPAGPGRRRHDDPTAALQRLAQNATPARHVQALQRLADTTTPIQRKNTYSYLIKDSAKRHYTDGWGNAYGITKDRDLKGKIDADGSMDAGEQEIDLGRQANPETHQIERCNITWKNKYRDKPNGDYHLHATVWHCGPTTR